MAISFIFPLASLIPIATIMFTCRTAPHLQNAHRSTGISKVQVTMGRLKARSATPTTRTTSSRAPLSPTRSLIIATHHRNLHVAFLPACMSTLDRIHGELLRLIFFISVVVSGVFINFLLHNHSVIYKIIIFFFRQGKRLIFSFFILLHKRAKPIHPPYIHSFLHPPICPYLRSFMIATP
jgi:hypothetical protein